MRISHRLTLVMASLALMTPAAHAQNEAPASGFAFWIRVPGTSGQEFTSSSLANPRFAVGFRTGRLQLGVGVGHTMLRLADRDSFEFTTPGGTIVSGTTEDETRATLYQIGPTVLLDIWRSGDQRTRANIAAGLSIGRLSVTDRNEFVDFPSGVVMSDEQKTTGSLLGFHIAFGGDYFLHRNFALGAEAGYQGVALRNIKEDVVPPPSDRFTVGANGTYVALRVTLVF